VLFKLQKYKKRLLRQRKIAVKTLKKEKKSLRQILLPVKKDFENVSKINQETRL